MKKILSLIGLAFIALNIAHAQDKKVQMEKERHNIQKELTDLQKAYSQVKGQKNVTLGQFNLLNRKIDLQEEYLTNINREVKYLNDDIYQSTLTIVKLQKQLDSLKSQYARSLVYTYKNHDTYDFLNFIFSAASFNDAIKRIAYLKSYRSYREQQVNSIKETQQQIEKRKQIQIGQMQEKKIVVQNQANQVKVLEDQRKEKDAAVNELRSKEKDFKKQIASKQKRAIQLKKEIDAAIAREIKKEKKADKSVKEKTTSIRTLPNIPNSTATIRTPGTKNANYLILNDKVRTLDVNFEKNKGELPWPVDDGYVSAHFGRNKDEIIHLFWENPGTTISTPLGAAVKVIFDGEVRNVFNMGDGMAVIIKHGKYFTTYGNLSSVTVSTGTMVSKGQVIGKAGASEDGSGGQIDLILMKGKQKINPEPWLRRR